ncbi:hypothetical protein CGRA01v4_04943 [Colletotrichum graminicola]|nr:hypothetical protein CGRA01v4_04943 [Colletotrichum graminicola]
MPRWVGWGQSCACVSQGKGPHDCYIPSSVFIHSSANRRSRPIFPASCSDRKGRHLHQRARGMAGQVRARPGPAQSSRLKAG